MRSAVEPSGFDEEAERLRAVRELLVVPEDWSLTANLDTHLSPAVRQDAADRLAAILNLDASPGEAAVG